MLFQVKVDYLYFGDKHEYYFDIEANSLNQAMSIVSTHMNSNKFFAADNELIAVVEIKHVTFSPVLDNKPENKS
jgi:hypothetical protein